jgi:hypothetical protein
VNRPGAVQAEVYKRGEDVIPFSLPATTHIVTRSAEGGVQKVVARKATDTAQVKLVRQHLRDIREQFLKGDFSGPAHIHGAEMPGLAELKAAQPGKIAIAYKDVKGGAQLTYSTSDAALVAALHAWFDANSPITARTPWRGMSSTGVQAAKVSRPSDSSMNLGGPSCSQVGFNAGPHGGAATLR